MTSDTAIPVVTNRDLRMWTQKYPKSKTGLEMENKKMV